MSIDRPEGWSDRRWQAASLLHELGQTKREASRNSINLDVDEMPESAWLVLVEMWTAELDRRKKTGK